MYNSWLIPKNVLEPVANAMRDEQGTTSDYWTNSVLEKVRFQCGQEYIGVPIDDMRRMCVNIRKSQSVRAANNTRQQGHETPPEYAEYLLSPHWVAFRMKVIEFWGGRCTVCYKQRARDVHHRTYERIGNENLTDCILLCRPCHEAVETLIRGKAISEGLFA